MRTCAVVLKALVVLSWTKQDLDDFLAQVKNQINDTKIHSYVDV
jgi:hypothetical protein